MRSLPTSIGIIHFVGIGGIGMSGIAEVLHALGYQVQGSDISQSGNVERLGKKGIRVFHGHASENIADASIVVYSSAIGKDNPELVSARARKLPVVRRAEMLSELMRLKWSVAVGGTHGKTTTTSLVGQILEYGNFDPTVINGGIVNAYGTNTRLGKSDWLVAEADESDGTFTRLPSTIGIITNIDLEHAEFYGGIDGIREAFSTFIENLPFYGFGVVCIDNPEVRNLVGNIDDKKLITYGFSEDASVQGYNVKLSKTHMEFDVIIKDIGNEGIETIIRNVYLPMIGEHNILNAIAAITVAHELGISVNTIKTALASFTGVKRRYTQTGEVNGIRIIDDYGHHPVEIKAVLNAARQSLGSRSSKIIAVVQPHRYSRLQSLFQDFCSCFHNADAVLVADVYPAGENPIEGIDKNTLAAGIKEAGHSMARAIENKDALPELIQKITSPGDIVIFLGAGDITHWAYEFPEKLASRFFSMSESDNPRLKKIA